MAGGAPRGLGWPLLAGFLCLWLAVVIVALTLAALPREAGGRVLVVFPPTLAEEARLLAIVAAGGRPVLPMAGGLAWLAEPAPDALRDDPEASGFVGRLTAAGAWAAFRPGVFAVLPEGGCFYISVRKPGPPQPHPPI